MREYLYMCHQCLSVWEIPHRWDTSSMEAETYCACGGIMHRVPQSPKFLVKGERYVNGERKLGMRFEVKNRDGSESAYDSVKGAYRGELDRGVTPVVARKNVEYLTKQGYVPGTWQHDFKQACLANNREGK